MGRLRHDMNGVQGLDAFWHLIFIEAVFMLEHTDRAAWAWGRLDDLRDGYGWIFEAA